MSNTEAARAWKYLRRNPAYIEARGTAAEPAPEEPAPFPLRAQTAADREAGAWGLLAWEGGCLPQRMQRPAAIRSFWRFLLLARALRRLASMSEPP